MTAPLKPSNAPDLVPGRTREAWIFAGAVAVAGAATGAIYGGLIGAAQRTPPLDLKPYLDLSWINVVTSWMAPAFESPLFAAAVLGLAAGALVLLCDAVLRRAFLAAKPGAAALAAVLVLLSPGFGTVLKLEGHWGVLAGAALGALGVILLMEAEGLAFWSGAALLAFAAVLHPVWFGVAFIGGLFCRSWRKANALGGFAGAAAAMLGINLFLQDWSGLGFQDRLLFAARDLAAAPVLAFSPNHRFDLPTGYEALTWTWPVTAGLAIHALLLGVGMMIGGVRRGAAVVVAATISVFGAALLVPGWVPGDRAFALAAMIAYAPLVALILGVVPERIAKAVLPGLVLGAGVVAAVLANDRAPNWTTLGAAMDLPRQRIAGAGSILAIEAEPDPARLVLFVNYASVRDAYAPSVVEAADKLLDARAPALHPDRLKSILDKLMNRAGRPRKTPEFTRLAAEVAAELKVVERLWGQSVALNLEVVARSLIELTPKVLDLAINWGLEFEGRMAAEGYLRMARSVLPVAARAGYYELSIQMLEALQMIGPESVDTAATIGIQRVFSGDHERGRAELGEAVKKLNPKSPSTGVARGVLGITILQAGDAAGALKELQAAWSAIGAGGVKNVTYTFAADTIDYYVVAEILLARYDAARAVDPGLAPQAARDLTDLLEGPLRFGVRRLPPLAIMGKLELLLGRRERALQFLREARHIPSSTLEDRSDGPVGRIAQPRYRRLALETLLAALLDDASAAAERDEIGAELQQLDAK